MKRVKSGLLFSTEHKSVIYITDPEKNEAKFNDETIIFDPERCETPTIEQLEEAKEWLSELTEAENADVEKA